MADIDRQQATTLGRAGEDFQRAEVVREDGSFSVRTKWATGTALLGSGVAEEQVEHHQEAERHQKEEERHQKEVERHQKEEERHQKEVEHHQKGVEHHQKEAEQEEEDQVEAINAAGPQTITGYIYCDNYFEFWFNGVLVKKDPMTFTPHNAVAVSFEWDGVSDKEYAIMCMDYASSSGYEYVETSNPGLGDGSLMAEFSDGTVTGAAWNVFVLTMGPTDASIAAGCSSSNLAPCAVVSTAEPAGQGWMAGGYQASGGWVSATEYTAAQETLTNNGGCSVNYDSANPAGASVTVAADECLDPKAFLSETRSKMIWSSDLERDNKLLFRISVPADASTVVQCPTCSAPTVDQSTQRVRRAHFGPQFMTWHSAFVLEFENALLSVDSTIGALPYWDSTVTSPSIFSETYFGSAPGTGSDSQVVDGAFPNWPIKSSFSLSDYNPTGSSPYTGSPIGMLRGPTNNNANAMMTRFGSGTYSFGANEFWICANLDGFWYDWYKCVEGDATVTGSFHGGPHGQVGGSSGGNSGDFEDPVTSPNDPLFFFHHAGVDRSMRWWMLTNAAKRSTFYGFPAADAEGIRENAGKSYYGQNLLDVMSSTWGFTAADLGFGTSSSFQTNADLLCHNGPSTSAYTYDSEVACSGGSTACSAVWGDTTTAAASGGTTTAAASGDTTTAAASGDTTTAEASGDTTTTEAFGDTTTAAASGDTTTAAASGGTTTAAASGDTTTAAASGGTATAAASGDTTTAAASGDTTTAAASGDTTTAAASGDTTTAAASGDTTTAAASGDTTTAAASGDTTTAAASGDTTTAAASGDTTTAAASGDTTTAETKVRAANAGHRRHTAATVLTLSLLAASAN
ncbi:unnamed protein product [Effrenium voratum]|nr:unnamed protein product [Effrenium voratum]